MFQRGKLGDDPRMLFSWYAADFVTDPAFEDKAPVDRANPSRASWGNADYLDQQQRRLPAHKFRRLHLNLPGLPEGSAFQAEPVMDAVERGVALRAFREGVEYHAFVDMSGGSSDDAVLAIGHTEGSKAIVDLVVNQGGTAPFDPRLAVERFATKLREYRVTRVKGDRYAGQTFIADFQRHGIGYDLADLTKSQLYEALEPKLNAREVALTDQPEVEQQLLGLVWRGGRIDHAGGEHDDWANAVAGLTHCLLPTELELITIARKSGHAYSADLRAMFPAGGDPLIHLEREKERQKSAGWVRTTGW